MDRESGANLLDVLDELLELHPQEREQRLAGFNEADRAKLRTWLQSSGDDELFMSDPPSLVRDAMRLLAEDEAEQAGEAALIHPTSALGELSRSARSGSSPRPQIQGYELLDVLGE